MQKARRSRSSPTDHRRYHGRHGLPTAIGGELAGITIPFKNQVTSNMSLVNELEQRYGAVAKVVNGMLMFVKRDGRTTAGGTEMRTTILNPGHFGTWKVKHSIRPSAGSVQPRGGTRDQAQVDTRPAHSRGGFGGAMTWAASSPRQLAMARPLKMKA